MNALKTVLKNDVEHVYRDLYVCVGMNSVFIFIFTIKFCILKVFFFFNSQ